MEHLKRTVEMMAQAQEEHDALLQRVHLECLLTQVWVQKMLEQRYDL